MLVADPYEKQAQSHFGDYRWRVGGTVFTSFFSRPFLDFGLGWNCMFTRFDVGVFLCEPFKGTPAES